MTWDAAPSASDGDLDLRAPEVDALLGGGRPAVEGFHAMLAEHGVVRGLIGPREVPRLWSRHLLNCAVVTRLLPERGVLVDIGSGAGLPGLVLAAVRPALSVVLVESMERRTRWLDEVVAELGLTNVTVRRGRAEEQQQSVVADVVTARAVAPMARLVPWSLPFLREGGRLLALKGDSAREELHEAGEVIRRWGGGEPVIHRLETVPGVAPTTVVDIPRMSLERPSPARTSKRAASRPSRRR